MDHCFDKLSPELPQRALVSVTADGQPVAGRVIACLDRSSSMVRHGKYALVSTLCCEAFAQLRLTCPEVRVETWWFARDVTCYRPLSEASDDLVPDAREYRDALSGGSAISDSIIIAIERAQTLNHDLGATPSRVVVWTDGWNRHARRGPHVVREVMARAPEIEVFLIGFVDRRVRAKLDRFVAEVGLPGEQVMVFGHDDDAGDTERAATESAGAFTATVTRWH